MGREGTRASLISAAGKLGILTTMSDWRYPREVRDSITQCMHTCRQNRGWRGGRTHLLRWCPSGRRVNDEHLSVKVASNALTVFA